MLSVGLLPEPEVRLDRLKRTCEWPPPPKTEVTPELSEIIEEAEERDEPPTLRADTQEDLTVEEGGCIDHEVTPLHSMVGEGFESSTRSQYYEVIQSINLPLE